jgi:glucose/arabinose dehydrogenase
MMSIIEEYSVSNSNPNVANTTPVRQILVASQPGGDLHSQTLYSRVQTGNHKGGQITFGPDGYLYIFFGDGGGNAARSSQDPLSFMGKILR